MNRIEPTDYFSVTSKHSDIYGATPAPEKENGELQPHVSRFFHKSGLITDVIHIKPIYYRTVENTWRPISEVTTYYGNHKIVIDYDKMDLIDPAFMRWLIRRQEIFPDGTGSLFITNPYKTEIMGLTDRIDLPGYATINFAVDTSTPDPDPETTTCDGVLAESDNGGGWSGAQTETSCSNPNDTNTSIGVFSGVGFRQVSTSFFRIERGHIGFDTSGVGASSTISAATVTLVTITNGINAQVASSNDDYFICDSSPASNTALVAGDYDSVGDSVAAPTQLSDLIDDGSISSESTEVFTLNASGRAAIVKDGVTNLGIRIGDDITAAPGAGNGINCWLPTSADDTGSNDPELAVTYTAGSTFIPKVMWIT